MMLHHTRLAMMEPYAEDISNGVDTVQLIGVSVILSIMVLFSYRFHPSRVILPEIPIVQSVPEILYKRFGIGASINDNEVELTGEDAELTDETESESYSNLEIYDVLEQLREFMNPRLEGGLWARYRSEILVLIESAITSREEGLQLLSAFYKTFGTDLIEELKKIGWTYSEIKDNLQVFIEYGIVGEEYPHNLTSELK